MTIVHIDCETYSRADLTRVGAWKYAQDVTTECLMVAWSVEDDPLGDYSGFHDFASDDVPPFDLLDLFEYPETMFVAFNANFEMAIFEHCLGIEFDPKKWICAQALALSWGFPQSLGAVSDAMQLPTEAGKMKEGRALIRKFSMPQPKDGRRIMPHDDPEAWGKFCEYCRRDVKAEAEIYRRLMK